MLRFIIRRLIITIPTVLIIITLTWLLVRLAPGNFYDNEKKIPAAVVKNIRAKYGLDKPLYVQYGRVMGGVIGFQLEPVLDDEGKPKTDADGKPVLDYVWHPYPYFGESLTYPGQTVNQILARSLPVSATLGFLAYLLALIVGLTAGTLAALRQNSKLDYGSMALAMLGISIPNFVLGPLLVLIFSLTLFWLPPGRWAWAAGPKNVALITLMALPAAVVFWAVMATLIKRWRKRKEIAFWEHLLGFLCWLLLFYLFAKFLLWSFPGLGSASIPLGIPGFKSIILPLLTLSALYMAYIARLTRSGMLEVLRADYVRTARAKGLSEKQVIFRHVMRGGLLPVISFSGPALAYLITGTVVVEQIFALPGLGNYFLNANFSRDEPLIIGIVAFLSIAILIFNLLVDITYALIDPRIRY